MAKKLIALISTKNKTPEQVHQEMMAALAKYKKVYAESEQTIKARMSKPPSRQNP